MELDITAEGFSQATLPRRYTCDGRDISPPLAFRDVPKQSRSLALIVDDPDAPGRAPHAWVHWVLYNLPPELEGLPEAVEAATLPGETAQGLNDWQRTGWSGPCPPSGRHRYVFRIYALDTVLPDLRYPTRAQLDRAMRRHILAQADTFGYYARG